MPRDLGRYSQAAGGIRGGELGLGLHFRKDFSLAIVWRMGSKGLGDQLLQGLVSDWWGRWVATIAPRVEMEETNLGVGIKMLEEMSPLTWEAVRVLLRPPPYNIDI